MKTMSIIGYGRIGKVLVNLFQDDFKIKVTDIKDLQKEVINSENVEFVTRDEALESDIIVYAVPISKFENLFKNHLAYFNSNEGKKLIIDVLSVKKHPKDVFDKFLPKNYEAILMHPMFGPDSLRVNGGFEGLPMIMDKYNASKENYELFKFIFKSKKLEVIEMSADEHDKKVAQGLGLSHFIGRILGVVGIERTEIDSLGAKYLNYVKEQSWNDSWELFIDMQNYNPYSKNIINTFGSAYNKVKYKLHPNKSSFENAVFGIQGGIGSFNQQALEDFVARNDIKDYKIEYLYVTDNVLAKLDSGEIDYGVFAVHNSLGGMVTETLYAMAKYNFEIIEEFFIPIKHYMMITQDQDIKDIDTIMTHPQVLRQCKHNLQEKFADYHLTSGTGDLVDHAELAKQMSLGKIAKNIAVIGPKKLSEIYNLKIVAENLQDDKTNLTSFLMVKRREY